ncbi:glycosyltransferase family 39 protein [Butyrivibrio sp. LC3010]|uniref:glycosyltransferase family 39 protein n=1 Tax=Butyrivibrio sp. LC3010 TaxID=1280680 RepID=UPI000409588B|nr:glycosyltransferase family 39 protein [Butyrivibrio sp. LC3010]
MKISNCFKNDKCILFFKCCLAAFCVLSICTKSSFLYPINNWGDAGCYYIQGRGILEGMVPYRDLAEQKGPAIFFVYSLGLLLSKSSFIGIFLIEIICAAFFLFFSIKIVEIFFDVNTYEFGIAALLAASVYSSYVNRHGGGPEEMSLALFSYMLYLAVRYVVKNKLPAANEMIMLGICAGLLFWTKYTLCGIYIALLIFMLIHSIKEKEAKAFWLQIAYFVLGCIIISIPILLFFAVNGSLMDLFINYFYNNIFLYRKNEAMYKGFGDNMKMAATLLFKARNICAIMLIILGNTWILIKKKYELFIGITGSFILSFVLINIGVVQKYGNLPLFVFTVFGFCPIVEFLIKRRFNGNFVINLCIVVVAVIVSYVFCLHTHDLFKNKSDMPQYAFADEMKSYGLDDYDMLVYGVLDEGYYFGDGGMPKWKAFVQLNQGGDELINLQNGYVDKKEPEFIISRYILCDTTEYNEVVEKLEKNEKKEVRVFDNFSYELIDEKYYFYEEYYQAIRLYKRNDI